PCSPPSARPAGPGTSRGRPAAPARSAPRQRSSRVRLSFIAFPGPGCGQYNELYVPVFRPACMVPEVLLVVTILALAAAVLYGTADFLGGVASRRASAFAVL